MARLLSVLVTVALLWVNWAAFEASRLYVVGQAVLRIEPLAGFSLLWRAYEVMPWNRLVRRELALALAVVDRREQVEPRFTDRVHAIAMSAAPYEALPLIARVEYLLNSGRWKEAEILLARLRRFAKLQPLTWVAEAAYAARIGDMDRYRRAVARGLQTQGHEREMAYLERLKERL
jgi:hypothetical protein